MDPGEKEGLLGIDGGPRRPGGPDWSRFGLSPDKRAADAESGAAGEDEQGHLRGADNELFNEEKNAEGFRPWWKANFLLTERVLFGTWDGVFTSCMINIFGVVIFLRTGWMVGNAGIGLSILIIFCTVSVALISVLSAIGMCERLRIGTGGVYFLLSHVLGARISSAVGVLYCFGQAVACSLYTVGFGESIAGLISVENEWVAKGIAIGVILLLLGINLAGVKWVIRLQLILLMTLFVAVLDFMVGSFVKTSPGDGVTGYLAENLRNNTGPEYLAGQNFFTIFGVFFPTATGVFAGINMSGDLRNPRRSIPVGTLSAVGVSFFLYLCFALILGASCERSFLQTDYMIAAKVSVVKVFLLSGLYVSSVTSCMGGLYGSPRILQAIAEQRITPFSSLLSKGVGPNQVPIFSLATITAISLIFILIGNVNVLGPIVTMPFMVTYACVDYAYFALAMSYDLRARREERLEAGGTRYRSLDHASPQGVPAPKPEKEGRRGPGDLDTLFPERLDNAEPKANGSPDKKTLLDGKKSAEAGQTEEQTIERQPRSCYSHFCNRWLSLFGVFMCVCIMFAIKWIYALSCLLVTLALYFYFGQANPGLYPGVADFSFYEWLRDGAKDLCRRGPPPPEEIIVAPRTPAMPTEAAQLTEDNEDFAERGKYHQSQMMEEDTLGEEGGAVHR